MLGIADFRKLALSLALTSLVLVFALAAKSSAAPGGSATFLQTDDEKTFTVPEGVTSVHVLAIGAHGGAFGFPQSDGGFGAHAEADLPVSPGQLLYVDVGGGGGGACCGSGGGFNGGGAGATGGTSPGGGGGGASDVRTTRRAFGAASLQTRLIVAGGGAGGGGTGNTGLVGGSGGDADKPGGAGAGYFHGAGGAPGTQSAGGAGAHGPYTDNTGNGTAGFLGTGGNGGSYTGAQGGGGGGGAYGGGGGSAGTSPDSTGGGTGAGGGGGGSSAFGSTASHTSLTADRTGTPLVTISWTIGGGGSGSKSGLQFGKLKRNKKRGTASLQVTVPGSGDLSVGGKGVANKRPLTAGGDSRLARDIPQAGTYTVTVKAKGRKKHKLSATGKVKVNAVITFKPTSGDVSHDTEPVLLKKS